MDGRNVLTGVRVHFIDLNNVDRMYWESFGGHRVFRPSLKTELLIREEAESYLRAGYGVGIYTDKEKINEIIQHQFGYYEKLLDEKLPGLASRHFMEFLLAMYDESGAIDGLWKSGQLNADEAARWAELAPKLRRGIKYLAERITLLQPDEAPKVVAHAQLQATDIALICAEQVIFLYTLSEQTVGLFPDRTELTIVPEGQEVYLDLKLKGFDSADYPKRVNLDRENRRNYFPNIEFQFDRQEQAAALNDAFTESFGFNYEDAFRTLGWLIDNVRMDGEGFDIPFCDRDGAIAHVAQGNSWDVASVARVVAGFSITPANMTAEGRKVWKPKQEHRAFRRGFFEFPHPTGPHLTWSKAMAKECWLLLMSGLAFQKMPPEWRTTAVNKGLDKLSNRAGAWFEDVVHHNLATLGAFGAKSLKGVGLSGNRIAVPPQVGEIDYLGYIPAEKLLVVLECKMTNGGHEPRYFKEDMYDFVTKGAKAYAPKFRNKAQWVIDNFADICSALGPFVKCPEQVAPEQVATAIVTHLPTFASYSIPDLPCVSLTELMTARESSSAWPYTLGVTKLPAKLG